MLHEKAPAKINLTLDVLGKRPDGYHEVEMIMTTVDLADRLSIAPAKDGKIRILSSDRYVPDDKRNLVWQAAELIRKKYGITSGVTFTLEKRIPVAAGLAGGSSDAAAALRGLNRLWGLGLSLGELAEIGADIGSDIPFCVHGGTSLATGRGEKLRHLPPPPNCWVILAKPDIGVSTADVYGRLDLKRMRHPDTPAMEAALRASDYEAMCRSVGNVLEPVTMDMHPEVAMLKNGMKRFGADTVLMSGSGPTVYGLVSSEARVPRIVNGLRGFCPEVHAVRMLGDGLPLD
ncbi:4-(cytidine 5'-diphospho)-2-C-methyl-D-erythritol kinase [Bhargavaea cecembensis]|uniref:4-(cytidine 5'-diphospho)-2-C-methyl-D-erythritol kinase n=1 Tax=Bhargavaea cecembensis TaxID=394098 RepID=UPI00058DA07B|nr:4-(cytidine 5'-diphospho)-2-C-methyl-D-erythritol kinase [Bhargavaea cecembensis]